MAELNIDLHPAQLEIFNSEKRFKIVAAGRSAFEHKQLTCTPDAVFINSCDGWGT